MSDAPTVPIGSLRASPSVPTEGHEAAVAGLRERLMWPHGQFSVHDPDPTDDHGPIYLVCPTSGLMVNFSSDPAPGLDAARVEWIADTLNDAMIAATQQATGEGVYLDAPQTKAIERAAMDAGCSSWRRSRLAMVEDGKVVGYPCFSRADMAELARLYREDGQQAVSLPEGVWLRGALLTIAKRPLLSEPGRGDYGKDRERCPSCGHAWHADEPEHHSSTCDRVVALCALNCAPDAIGEEKGAGE